MMHFAKQGVGIPGRFQHLQEWGRRWHPPGSMEPRWASETGQPEFESQPFYIPGLPLHKLLCLSEPVFLPAKWRYDTCGFGCCQGSTERHEDTGQHRAWNSVNPVERRLTIIVRISQPLYVTKSKWPTNPEYPFPTAGLWVGGAELVFSGLGSRSHVLWLWNRLASLMITPEHKRASPLPGSLPLTSPWPKQVSGHVQG